MTTHTLSRALPVSLILMSALTACGDVDHPPPVGQGGEPAPPSPPLVSLAGRSSSGGSDSGATSGMGDGANTSFGGTVADGSFGGAAGTSAVAGTTAFAGTSAFAGTPSFAGTNSNTAGTNGL